MIERREFARWLSADSKNSDAYERHELAWDLAAELENDPDVQTLLADAEDTQAKTAHAVSYRRRRLGLLATAAAAACVVAVAGWVLITRDHTVRYATAIGELRTVTLPDQSRMTLNTGTRVRVLYRDNARVVQLDEGEATFDVAQDAARPFEVHAHDGIARALGTQFNVMASADRVTVSVLSGHVQIISPSDQAVGPGSAHAAVLNSGEAMTYSAHQVSAVRAANLAPIQAWHARRVQFMNLTLNDALEEFNRYTTVPLVVGDPSIAGLRISGTFRAGESQALVQTLQAAFGLRSERRGNAIVLLRSDGK
jgi:transmembrane sensor